MKIMLVICSHRALAIESETAQSGILTTIPPGVELMKCVGLEASIAKSRSYWTTIFYDKYKDYDILSFVDDDMIFSPQDYWKLIRICDLNKCVVGAPYMARKFPPKAIVSKEGGFYFNRGIIEVDGVGTGFFAVHRNVLKSFVEDPAIQKVDTGKILDGQKIQVYYPTFAEIVVNNVWLSEDYGFCYNAKRYNHKILADTDMDLGHVGTYVYTKKDLLLYQNNKELIEEIGVKK